MNSTVNEQLQSIDDCNKLVLDCTNDNNSKDYVGKIHNESLNHAATLVDVTVASDDELFGAITDYFDNYSGSGEPTKYLSDEHLSNGLSLETYALEYVNTQDKLKLQVLNGIHEILITSDLNDPQEVISSITSYENELINGNIINSSPEILGFISLFRHSLKYWNEAYVNECHPFYFVLNQNEVQTKGVPWELIVRAAVDMAVYNDCLSSGGGGAQTLSEAEGNCAQDAAYSSARAFHEGCCG